MDVTTPITKTAVEPLEAKKPGEHDDCVGNPCDPATGNKYMAEADYAGQGPFSLRLTRSYNSLGSPFVAQLGKAWNHNFGASIGFSGDTASVFRQDGKTHGFVLQSGQWVSDGDVTDKLERLFDGGGTATGWRLTTAKGDVVEVYDNSGRLVSIANRAGLTQTLGYDSNGKLASVQDHFGRTLLFAYQPDTGLLQSVRDPADGLIQYTYENPADGSGLRLASVRFQDDSVRQYVYDEPDLAPSTARALLTGIVDENGQRFATYSYGADERAISTEHSGGAERATLQYNGDGTTLVTDAFNVARTYTFQTFQGVRKLVSIAGLPCDACGPASREFDVNGFPSSTIDWNGNRTNNTYDLARNVEISRTEGLTSSGGTTPQTRTISTQWHGTFRLPTGIAEPLRITAFVYDPDGTQCGARGALCSKSIQATTDANGSQGFSATASGAPRTGAYTYNANGNVLTVNGPRTDVSDVTTYTYYANNDADLGKRGNVATITSAAGHTTSIAAYNAHGQPLTIVDPNGLTTTLTYDARQRLTSRNVGGETTTYTYDAAGQLTKVTLPDNSFLSYTYDAAHRLTAIQDNLGNRIAYTLDGMGNRTQEQVFDPANALAQTRSRVFSNLNRLFRELGASSQTTEYGYDNQGNITSVKNPLNHLTVNQYDPLNRLKQVTDPNSGVTNYAYNGLDALTQVTDPRNLVTGYTVDGLGNLTQQQSPDTGTAASTYDSAGNLLTQADAKGQVTTYAYDALNRVMLITFHDGSKQTYAYDQGTNGVGRLSSITETNSANQTTSVIAYGYDQKGRVTSETRTVNGAAYTLAYAHDSSGRLTGMTYPSGRTVTYGLDALGRVTQVTTTKDNQSQVVVQYVQYHPFGGAKSWTLGNGQISNRAVDQDGRIAGYNLGAANYTVGFDAASRITGISQTGNPANANVYGYDNLDRLTSAVLPNSSFSYGYDAVGNRITKTTGANTELYTYSATSNRLSSISPARSFLFDANGSITNDSINQYTYDTRGRLNQATTGQGSTSYQVNALGQRVRKTNSQGDTVYHYDRRGKLIAETGPGGVLKREIFYLGDIPVAVAQ